MVEWPKDGIVSAVYSPPRPDFPCLAILFGPDGEPLASRSWPTKEDANTFIVEMMALFAAQTGHSVTGA